MLVDKLKPENDVASSPSPAPAEDIGPKIKLANVQRVVDMLRARAKWAQRMGYGLLAVFALTVLAGTAGYFNLPAQLAQIFGEPDWQEELDRRSERLDARWQTNRALLVPLTAWVVASERGDTSGFPTAFDETRAIPTLIPANSTLISELGYYSELAFSLGIDGEYILTGSQFSPEQIHGFKQISPGVILAYGEDGIISRTIDQGNNWVDEEIGRDGDVVGVLALGDETTMAIAGGVLFRQRNSTREWDEIDVQTNFYVAEITALADQTLLAHNFSGAVYRSEAGDEAWTRDAGRTVANIRQIFERNEGILIALDDRGGITRYAGQWRSVRSGVNAYLTAVIELDDHSLLAYGEGGAMTRSTDEGASWLPIETNTEAALLGLIRSSRGYLVYADDGSFFRLDADLGQAIDQSMDFETYRASILALPPGLHGLSQFRSFYETADALAIEYQDIETRRGRSFASATNDERFLAFLADCRPGGSEGQTGTPPSTSHGEIITACTQAFRASEDTGEIDLYRSLSQTAGGALLFLFFLTALTALYRYNLKLSSFYHSRADALELMTDEKDNVESSVENINAISSLLAAEHVDFRHVRSPTQDIAGSIRAALGRR